MVRKKNISIYGSCITKDPFTSVFNKNYKNRYNCIINDQRHSFISTMQDPQEINGDELMIFPETSSNLFLSKCIRQDFEKTFIDLMSTNKIDYLVFDINFEVESGIIIFDDGKILTNIKNFNRTEYYSKLDRVKYLNIFEDTDAYFKLWTEYCDKFFDFLKKHSPDTKIVLAEVRALDTVQRADLSVYIESDFTRKAHINNIFYKMLENYIKENYDVDVITFDKDTLLNENHIWGKFYIHYDDEYYTNFLNKFDRIVAYNDLKEKYEDVLNILNQHNIEYDEDIEILFQDNGISDDYNNNWVDTSTLPMLRKVGKNYTSLSSVNSNGRGVIRPVFSIYDGLNIEFDIYHDSKDIDEPFATIRYDTKVHANIRLNSVNLKMKEWHHVKLSINNHILIMTNTTNDNFKKWKLKSFNRFYFGVSLNTKDLRYKNFRIYYE